MGEPPSSSSSSSRLYLLRSKNMGGKVKSIIIHSCLESGVFDKTNRFWALDISIDNIINGADGYLVSGYEQICMSFFFLSKGRGWHDWHFRDGKGGWMGGLPFTRSHAAGCFISLSSLACLLACFCLQQEIPPRNQTSASHLTRVNALQKILACM